MYVMRCVDLYVKNNGFTKNINEAKRFSSIKQAKQQVHGPWTPVKVEVKKNT